MGFDLITLPDHVKRCLPAHLRKELGKSAMTFEEALLSQEAKSEKILQKQIRGILGLQDIPFSNSRTDKKTTNAKGTPDFLFAIKGMPFAWECKMPGERLRPDQEAMLLRYKRQGWITDVIHTLEQAIYEIKTWMGSDYK